MGTPDGSLRDFATSALDSRRWALRSPRSARRPSKATAVNSPDDNRPLAGIAVAILLAGISLFLTLAPLALGMPMVVDRWERNLLQAIPGLTELYSIDTAAALLANSALLWGSVLCFRRHPRGVQIVRGACWAILAITLLSIGARVVLVWNSRALPTLDGNSLDSLVGGLVAGGVGSLIKSGLVLFLFRNADVEY